MRAKIMFMSGDEQAKGLVLAVQEVLTDLALAFGHQFLIKEELISKASAAAYGSAMTQEAIDACADCQAVLCLSPDDEGLAELAQGLECTLVCHVYSLPAVLSGHSLLKSQALPQGLLCAPLKMEGAEFKAACKGVYRLAGEERLNVTEIPPRGKLHAQWENEAGTQRLSLPILSWFQRALSEALPGIIKAPDAMGLIFASPSAADSVRAVLGALSGLECLLHRRYDRGGESPLYALKSQSESGDEGNPFGLLYAVSDMLRHALHLVKEAELLSACISNVLDAGWRTADISLPGEPRVSAGAICSLIREQIALAGEFIQK